MSTKDLQAKVKELKELQRMAEELAAEITNIQDEIKEDIKTQMINAIVELLKETEDLELIDLVYRLLLKS